jgi:hypothetical protein
MSNHPITPLASAQVNHDAPTVVDPNVSPIYRGRDRPVVCSGAHRVGRNPGGAETLIARADRASWCASRPTRMLVW